MGFFKDWRSHYTAGFLYGLGLRLVREADAEQDILNLDLWGYAREWDQNLRGENPNDSLSSHQLQEAAAWGAGARKGRGIDLSYPSPPYPEDYEWEA